MKTIKEKQMLVKWARVMGDSVDPELLAEVTRYEQIQKDIADSVKQNSIKDLFEASQVAEQFVEKINIEYPKPPTLIELLEVLKEETNELVQTQTTQEPTPAQETKTTSLANLAAEHITKEIKEEQQSFQQPVVPLVDKELGAITNKLKYLEQFIAKIAAHGPGGGTGDVINLDFPVKLVTNDYTITRKDYYVGVNAASTVTITLPDSIGFPGRKIVIKDESGNCSSNPIVVSGNVDNDAGGFILQMDNGGIQMIYREGWRII